MLKSAITLSDEMLYYDIAATGFIQYMIRTIIGTLIEVGKGKIAPSEIKEIIASKKRENAGATAPPQGLFMVKVNYSATK